MDYGKKSEGMNLELRFNLIFFAKRQVLSLDFTGELALINYNYFIELNNNILNLKFILTHQFKICFLIYMFYDNIYNIICTKISKIINIKQIDFLYLFYHNYFYDSTF